jgi:hypothetical protein
VDGAFESAVHDAVATTIADDPLGAQVTSVGSTDETMDTAGADGAAPSL